MTIQDVVWWIAVGGIGLVALVFVTAIVQSGKAQGDASKASISLRTWLFLALGAVFVVGSWKTLRKYPIPSQRESSPSGQVVEVVGRMWSWQITPDTLQAGGTVEFRVTSADVNHGFAIYAPDGHIMIQTQAMPGYTNRLLYAFSEPGTYVVQCLEFCGLGHAPMKGTFQVVAGGEE